METVQTQVGAYRVERLQACHLEGVAELERLCFSEPWSAQSLALLCSEGGVGFVCVSADGCVAAYGGMLTVLDEGQITNIAVHPDFRRQGMGSAVVEALISFAQRQEIRSIFLEVRASNEGAIALYRGLGFTYIGERKNFYRLPTESAKLFAWRSEKK